MILTGSVGYKCTMLKRWSDALWRDSDEYYWVSFVLRTSICRGINYSVKIEGMKSELRCSMCASKTIELQEVSRTGRGRYLPSV